MSSLKDLGFVWASLPSSEIKPLQLLIRTGPGEAEQLNTHLTKLFLPVNVPVPVVGLDQVLPGTLNLSEKVDTSVSANANFLQQLLRIFTGDFSVSVSWEKQNGIEISLKDPKKQVVDLIDLDTYLHDAQPNDAAKSFIDKLKADQLYIITDILKSKSFTISCEKSTGTDIGAEIPTQVASGKVSLDHSNGGKLSMTANGNEDITVAVKAVRIFYDKPGFLSGKPGKFRLSAEEKLNIMKGEEEFPTESLEAVFVNPQKS